MGDRGRSGRWANVAGVAMLGAAVALAVGVGGAGREAGRPAAAGGHSSASAGRPIACEDPGCSRCRILRAERVDPDRDLVADLERRGVIESD